MVVKRGYDERGRLVEKGLRPGPASGMEYEKVG